MLLTWSLFAMWGVLNLVDIAISWLAVSLGASEVGALWWVTGDWLRLAINKMALALLIGGVLAYFRKDTWLALLGLGMLLACIWGGWVVIFQASLWGS